jgi:hypothetical protein
MVAAPVHRGRNRVRCAQINRNFDHDYETYGEVKRNLRRLVAMHSHRTVGLQAVTLLRLRRSEQGLRT